MSCCPPGSAPYLAADHKDEGSTGAADGVSYYQVGSGEAGLLLCPDVWGWNGGRTRAIADDFAKQGFNVWVPKLIPAYKGGTDGDGLPPDFNVHERGSEIGPLVTSGWRPAKVVPKVIKVIESMKSAGVKRIGIIGFCYGGWIGMQVAAESEAIMCAVACHPSISMEVNVGGDPIALAARSTCPWAFFPAGNPTSNGADPDIYDGPDGAMFKALEDKFPGQIHSKRYPEQIHGFVTRGNIKENNFNAGRGDGVKAAVQDCLEEAVCFFKARGLLGSKPKLHYFPAAGRGELIRLIASAGGLDIEEVAASPGGDDKLAFCSPGGLPVLEHGDLKMAQSSAIELYIAAITPRYRSRTPQQKAIDAQFCCIKEDLLADAAPFIFSDEKKANIKKGLPEVCDKWFSVIESRIPETGFINGFAFPTAADLAVLNVTRAFMPFGAAYQLAGYDPLAKYPKLKALDGRVASCPAVKAYLQKSKSFDSDPFGVRPLQKEG